MRKTVKLAGHPASARAARDEIRRALDGQRLGSRVLDTALLLTSELVVNASVRGRGEVTLEVALEHNVLRVSVADAGQFEEHGRGLGLVEDLAARWGVDRTDAGPHTVWFELAYVTPTA